MENLVERIQASLKNNDGEVNFLFGDLMGQLTPFLLTIARAKGTRDDADDLVAQTYVGLLDVLQADSPVHNVRALARKILENRIVDYIRRKKSKKRQPHAPNQAECGADDSEHTTEDANGEDDEDSEVDDAHSPSYSQSEIDDFDFSEVADPEEVTPYESWETRATLNPILSDLPPLERQVLVLRHYFDLNVEETAKRLKITPDQVKKRCRDAIKMAHQKAEEEGVDVEDLLRKRA